MTQEQKDLLLKDLCARLLYGVKVNAPFTSNKNENAKGYKINGIKFGVVECTPILFGEKKQRNSIVIEAFSEKYNQYCSIDIELDNIIEEVKPYLFPLSSMTEKQALELYKLFGIKLTDSIGWDYIKINEVTGITFFLRKGFDVETHLDKLIDWLLKNHFDYRGLIPMGLALDATGLNIY